jgi:hypothetical protein
LTYKMMRRHEVGRNQVDIMYCNIMHAAFGTKVRVLSGAFRHSRTLDVHESVHRDTTMKVTNEMHYTD